jgi:hypothetical protein
MQGVSKETGGDSNIPDLSKGSWFPGTNLAKPWILQQHGSPPGRQRGRRPTAAAQWSRSVARLSEKAPLWGTVARPRAQELSPDPWGRSPAAGHATKDHPVSELMYEGIR